jgi:antitoxin VapB
MALQIANPTVVDKIHELARITGLTKTAAVEKAVDEMLRASSAPGITPGQLDQRTRMMSLLAQLDRVSSTKDNAAADIVWDSNGLPT